MTPCPDRAPDAARNDESHGTKVRGEAGAAARLVWPEEHSSAKREREQDAEIHQPFSRATALDRDGASGRGRLRALDSTHFALLPTANFALRQQLLVRHRRELPVDLRELLFPIAFPRH